MRLVTRADDAGSCRSANDAILECVEAGIIKNVSFMAVGPEIEHAAQLFGGRDDIACGLHVCLNAEWEAVKWGPLTNAPSLCEDGGAFWPFPHDTKERGFVLEEATREIEAQLLRLRELGLGPSYVDEHMGVSWISPELRAFIASLGLFDAHPIPSLPDATNQTDDFLALEWRLRNATGDRNVWVTHPGKIAPDMSAFFLKGGEPGIVARERHAERQVLLDSRLPTLLAKWKTRPTRYDEPGL